MIPAATTTGRFAIAIDGPAASGKSTIARHIARRLGFLMVNSGAIYRAITWKVLRENIDPSDPAAVLDLLRRTRIQTGNAAGLSTIAVDGADPGDALRSPDVNAHVSAISAIPEVRSLVVDLLRDYLSHSSVVMEGRDIGSVVFPDTPFKIYVDAAEHVRAARRREVGEIDSVASRDAADSRRETAPLKVADGSAILDTSHHTIDSAVDAAIDILRQQGLPV